MFRKQFGNIDRLVRSMAASRWTRLAIMRSTVSAPWLDSEVEHLFRLCTPESIRSLDEEEAEDWLENFRQLDTQIEKVVQAVPFERKLGAMMRPFRHRFQAIIRLRAAVRACLALLRQRLEPAGPLPLNRGNLPIPELLDARDLIARDVPGWSHPGMELYDYV